MIVGESTIVDAVNKAGLKAEKQVAKELDVKPKDIDKAVQEQPPASADQTVLPNLPSRPGSRCLNGCHPNA